jgi:indoleamine 2,3-dioxygenase
MNHPSLDSLNTIPLLRRAHLVLSFLSHFYVHCSLLDTSSSSGGEEIVPEIPTSLASPWMEVSDRLDIPPILTYADTVLWNWGFKDPSKGFDKE